MTQETTDLWLRKAQLTNLIQNGFSSKGRRLSAQMLKKYKAELKSINEKLEDKQ